MDDVFAAGDLGEALKAVEAMEAAGLEAADARDKLTRVTTAMKKVMQYVPHLHLRIEPFGSTQSCMYSFSYSSRCQPVT